MLVRLRAARTLALPTKNGALDQETSTRANQGLMWCFSRRNATSPHMGDRIIYGGGMLVRLRASRDLGQSPSKVDAV